MQQDLSTKVTKEPHIYSLALVGGRGWVIVDKTWANLAKNLNNRFEAFPLVAAAAKMVMGYSYLASSELGAVTGTE